MRGTMIVIRVDGAMSYTPIDRQPSLEVLKHGLGGGYLELVPGFDLFPFDNDTYAPCVAFCDEEGKLKGLPMNEAATRMWALNLGADVLVGDIVILTGDEAFMRSLSDDGDDNDEQ